MPFDVMAAIRWVAGLGLAVLLFTGGMSCGRQGSADELLSVQQALANSAGDLRAARDSLSAASGALNLVNRQAEIAKQQAEHQQQLAAEAVVAAQEAGKDYARRFGELEAELEAAKADPNCRRMLEMPACAALH